jgi:hypothetical protein
VKNSSFIRIKEMKYEKCVQNFGRETSREETAWKA